MPEPIITTSAFAGRWCVVLWPRRSFEGWVCQNEAVEFVLGRVAWPEEIASLVMMNAESSRYW